jgi:hypothetical protein
MTRQGPKIRVLNTKIKRQSHLPQTENVMDHQVALMRNLLLSLITYFLGFYLAAVLIIRIRYVKV